MLNRTMTEKRPLRTPRNVLAEQSDLDVISPEVAPTLDQMFLERTRRTPDKIAYTEFNTATGEWEHYTWAETAREIDAWAAALHGEGLVAGDRIALCLRNRRHWVIFDQAALRLGLVVVPLYVEDRPDNMSYMLQHSGAVLLLLENESTWVSLVASEHSLDRVERVLILDDAQPFADGKRLISVKAWRDAARGDTPASVSAPDQLASIIYTSGTQGRPKGVMLSHKNMLVNAYAGMQSIAVTPDDVFLSFLPLSHTLERTVGYYIPVMAGARVAYNRSIELLSEDLRTIKPTVLITVPRIYERVRHKINEKLESGSGFRRGLFSLAVETGWRRFQHACGSSAWHPSLLLWPLLERLVARKVAASFGGKMRLSIVGGAPVSAAVAKMFCGLGINLMQGYGLTEASPIVSVNTAEINDPVSVGVPLHGVEVKIGNENEILVRGENTTRGYWKDEQASSDLYDAQGWMHTGDQAEIADGVIKITGRLKDVLVMAIGEKVSPTDMEAAIMDDPLFPQAMVIGEQLPYLTALVVLNADTWKRLAKKLNLDPRDKNLLSTPFVEDLFLKRIGKQIHEFPGYAQVRRVTSTLDEWTIENGLLTPTLKYKRNEILERFRADVERMYAGHMN